VIQLFKARVRVSLSTQGCARKGEDWMSGCQPDAEGGLPACPKPLHPACSLAAESAKLAGLYDAQYPVVGLSQTPF
jgi:hypothetical protein